MTARTVSVSEATRRLLEIAREHIGMDVAWVSQFQDDQQEFLTVSAAPDVRAPQEGATTPLDESYCVRVLDGRLPGVVPDSEADPLTRDLPLTGQLGIGSYVGAPVRGRDGAVRGMLCCTSAGASPELAERDRRLIEMLAQVVGELNAAGAEEREAAELAQVVRDLVAGAGRRHVLQPIVDLRSGAAVGYEALARFDVEPFRPDLWFARAETVGLRHELELASAASALGELSAGRAGYVSINLSPDVVCSGGLAPLFSEVDPARVVVEITEHAAIGDYEALVLALAPHRERGLRIAIDDAGAGYASFRHILQLSPDLIKADISLVRGIDADPVRQALVSSLLGFARSGSAQLVAEGVETQAELDTLARLGVAHVQGYLLGRPTEDPPVDGFTRPSSHVHLNADVDLTVVLAEAVREAQDLESLARPLLDVVLRLTGLETSYLTVLEGEQLTSRFVRNAGGIQLAEGFSIDWKDSLCSALRRRDLLWTGEAQTELVECQVAADMGLRTFVSTPVVTSAGDLVGTLCAGSRHRVFLSDSTLAQVRLVAHVLGGRSAQPRERVADA